MTEIKLHVIADDFGRSTRVDTGVLKAWQEGILSGASVLVNGSSAEEALQQAVRLNLPVGLHANLVEGNPTLQFNKLPSLSNTSGHFHGSASKLFLRLIREKINLGEVRAELVAQIEWMISRGVKPAHIDSHQHVHMLPRLLPVFLSIQKQYHVPRLRMAGLPMEGGVRSLTGFMKYGAISLFGEHCRRRINTLGFSPAPRVLGLTRTGYLDKHYLLKMLPNLKPGEYELICHPSLNATSAELGWPSDGTGETQALCDEQVVKCIQDCGITLVKLV